MTKYEEIFIEFDKDDNDVIHNIKVESTEEDSETLLALVGTLQAYSLQIMRRYRRDRRKKYYKLAERVEVALNVILSQLTNKQDG